MPEFAVRSRHSRWALWLAFLGALAWDAARAADVSFTVVERLNRRWAHEWVAYPFRAEPGACVSQSVTLTGPTGPLPVQLANVECWPGTAFVKTAALTFVVDELTPLATNVYTATYGTGPAAKPAVAADLTVTTTAARLEAVSSRFGIRLLLGEASYAPPVAAATVPGPVLGMRLADGTWFGGSGLFGDTPVAGYAARITDVGPVFVRVECGYRYADGKTQRITVQFNAQSDRVCYTTSVSEAQPKDGWTLRLTGLPPLAFQFMPEEGRLQPGTHAIKGWKEREIASYPPGLISNLAPWGDWFSEFTQTTLCLAFIDARAKVVSPGLGEDVPLPLETPATELPDGHELVIRRIDAGAWVTPGSGVRSADACLPLMKTADGTLLLNINNKAGTRKWSIGENPSFQAKLARVLRPTNTMQDDMEELNVVKDMVLAWPDTGLRHPSLFLGADDFTKAGTQNPAVLKRLQDVKSLRDDLGSYVFFDTMRHAAGVICQYDALIDSELIAPPERQLLRAQMAYLAYRLASPANWSAARGYASGNPNMTVAHLINQGLAACVLRDHPLAKEWSAEPIAAMDGWLGRIDAAGHWPESSGYARVAESKMVYLAIASQRAGLQPFLSDPRFKRLVLYYERTLTPPDPQRLMGDLHKPLVPRVTPPYGRGGNGAAVGIGGLLAKATEKSDPALSRLLQWSYVGSQFSTQCGEDMYGYDQLMTDRTLPAERPDWRSELLPSVGALFRSGLGSPDENYLLLVSKNPTNPDGEIWPSEVGALTLWFEHGKPLTRVFPAGSTYPYLHGLMLNRVMLASHYTQGKATAAGYCGSETLTGFTALPRLDYLGERYHWTQTWSFFATPPPAVPDFPPVEHAGVLPKNGVTWHRQALYVRDALPGGKNYLVLRDSLTGGQPTQWQFWTLSKKLTPVDGQRVNVVDIAADTPPPPGVHPEPVELTGNHFVVTGQFGLDLDYYVASPADTPRHTIRHGFDATPLGPTSGFRCEQDLLHLQLPGDGVYFVALVPRAAGEAAPTFVSLAEDKVIKVSGPFGSDYVFLSDAPGTATAEGATFAGTAACVQDRAGGLVLALAAAGEVACKGYALTAHMAANLCIAANTLTLTLPDGHAGGQLTVQAPDGFRLAPDQAQITLEKAGKTGYRLTIPAAIRQVVLAKAP